MKQEEKLQVKAYLLKEKAKLKQRIAELKELTKPIEPDCAIGRVSRMDAINNRSINEAALQKNLDKQKKINISLEHIEDEDFGNCIHCGEPIPIQRLLIMPGALCIRCARRV
jgi:DnaK suppressor protein